MVIFFKLMLVCFVNKKRNTKMHLIKFKVNQLNFFISRLRVYKTQCRKASLKSNKAE